MATRYANRTIHIVYNHVLHIHHPSHRIAFVFFACLFLATSIEAAPFKPPKTKAPKLPTFAYQGFPDFALGAVLPISDQISAYAVNAPDGGGIAGFENGNSTDVLLIVSKWLTFQCIDDHTFIATRTGMFYPINAPYINCAIMTVNATHMLASEKLDGTCPTVNDPVTIVTKRLNEIWVSPLPELPTTCINASSPVVAPAPATATALAPAPGPTPLANDVNSDVGSQSFPTPGGPPDIAGIFADNLTASGMQLRTTGGFAAAWISKGVLYGRWAKPSSYECFSNNGTLGWVLSDMLTVASVDPETPISNGTNSCSVGGIKGDTLSYEFDSLSPEQCPFPGSNLPTEVSKQLTRLRPLPGNGTAMTCGGGGPPAPSSSAETMRAGLMIQLGVMMLSVAVLLSRH